MDSILTSIKKLLGITEDYNYFDPDIIMHINTVMMTLTQIGVGPSEGFVIEDETATWDDFVQDTPNFRVDWVKSYIYLKVRLLFDPPLNQGAKDAIMSCISELEFRLNVAAES